ncbi:MAG: M20/M25/M40 family metallo-hydrolase [Gemmatimonadales bacterium]|jgi:acetylornithine deacetylase/succinyl-diaminopimelate desuccinylase-like protein|nr:M20/M25/M40 family metallo-hydrolase [Gemmatimonadales bacterium]MDG2241242.1 M20/M25/M40 family metallo-hydrolase [Longimicrobiales bacterium]MBT3497647.1 M20/M25/M40 family metallo-hydrolase [Gemmatimonadales bacterium]MBT3774970.1 M20/M25/M40 family metallo-hydrolase [Gemmatimonadales bacterium]MBT3958862.1 M20/M25/M40 family metallo-hydrolase [Gemmatimonadales bacterium]
MKHLFARSVLTALACGILASPAAAQLDSARFVFSTDEKLDATATPAYEGSHDAIYAYIDENFEAHLANLQRWLRQRSVSAQNDGITEMAEMLRSDLEALGFAETAVVPTDGHPGVWGYYDAGAERTLMVYLMYDVQPVNEEDWESPPFDAEVIESGLGEILMARGATNQKGPERAFLNAIESIIAVEGTLPVNLMVLAEGEEELGSPHYYQLVDQFEDRLKTADGAFFPFNSQGPTGGAGMSLGVKGILYTEIEAVGNAGGGPIQAEIHGSYKAIVDSPPWRLVQALSSLVSEDGNTILVPGYYDDVRPPTGEEQRLINAMADTWNDEAQQDALGVEQWIDGITGRDAIMRYLYHPTLNIDGIWGGYTGEGVKTILPHMATAKVDSRLPYGLDPDTALARIRRHLDAEGFEDIVVRKLSGYPAAQTSVEAPIVQAAIGVFNKYSHTPQVSPRLAGSAPFYQFTERLGLPLVFAGFGHGSGAHAPNEYMVVTPAEGSSIAGLREIERAYVDLMFALASQRPITQ